MSIKNARRLILTFSLLFIIRSAKCQQKTDSVSTWDRSILPVPALGFEPETSFYFGAVGLYSHQPNKNLSNPDTITKTSSAKVEFNYTLNKQIIAYTEWNIFTKQNAWLWKGNAHYKYFPDRFWAVGKAAKSAQERTFASDLVQFDFNGLKRFKQNLFVGGGITFSSMQNIRYLDFIDTPTPLKRFNLVGLDLEMEIDQRKNNLNPQKGHYFSAIAGSKWNVEGLLPFLSGDYRFYFKPVKDRKQFGVINAFQVIAQIKDSNTPIYNLSKVGGTMILRGYYYGRFVNDNLIAAQNELRIRLPWRLGLTAFYASGILNNNSFTDTYWANSFGAGFRFLMDKAGNVNLRVDFAKSEVGNGIYIAFGEAF